jgi:hypothetical protein
MLVTPMMTPEYPHVCDTGVEPYRIREASVEWVAPPLPETQDGSMSGDGMDFALSETALSGADGIAENETIHVPDTEWTERTKKRLQALIAKAALKTITPQEKYEMRELQALRRANSPGLTYEELVRTAERDRLLDRLKNALEAYVNFIQ